GSVSAEFRSVNVGEFFVRVIRCLPDHEKVISVRGNPEPLLIERVRGDGNSVRTDHDAVAVNQRAVNLMVAITGGRASVMLPHDETGEPSMSAMARSVRCQSSQATKKPWPLETTAGPRRVTRFVVILNPFGSVTSPSAVTRAP